jgi:hypothetical protein
MSGIRFGWELGPYNQDEDDAVDDDPTRFFTPEQLALGNRGMIGEEQRMRALLRGVEPNQLQAQADSTENMDAEELDLWGTASVAAMYRMRAERLRTAIPRQTVVAGMRDRGPLGDVLDQLPLAYSEGMRLGPDELSIPTQDESSLSRAQRELLGNSAGNAPMFDVGRNSHFTASGQRGPGIEPSLASFIAGNEPSLASMIAGTGLTAAGSNPTGLSQTLHRGEPSLLSMTAGNEATAAERSFSEPDSPLAGTGLSRCSRRQMISAEFIIPFGAERMCRRCAESLPGDAGGI